MKQISPRTERALKGVHPALVAVVRLAWTYLKQDYQAYEGVRTLERQKAYVARGVSKTLKSYHLIQKSGYGHAIDIAPLVNGAIKWPNDYGPWKDIERAMKRAARELGVPIEWGGDWRNRWDKPHWQVPRTIQWTGAGRDVPKPKPKLLGPDYGNDNAFVEAFQTKLGLEIDGYAGPVTYKALGDLK